MRTLGATLLALLAQPAIAADYLVVTAEGPGSPSRLSVMSGPLKLPQGVAVILLNEAGELIRVHGPYVGEPSPSADGIQLRGIAENFARSYGTRRSGNEPDDWRLIDVTAAGKQCVLAGQLPRLWRPASDMDQRLSVWPQSRPVAVFVSWPAGQSELQWPAQLPVRDGEKVDFALLTSQATVTLHVVPPQAKPGQVTLSLAQAGCFRQMDVALAHLEPEREIGP